MLSWIWLCDRDRSVTLCHKAGACFTWCVQELLRCSARTVLSWSRQILRLSRLGCYGQIQIQYSQHLCRLSAIFHIFRCLGSFFLAEPPERPFSLWKSQLVPLVSLILCFQPTDHNCCRSETPPWGQGAVKWMAPQPLFGHRWGMWMEPPGLPQHRRSQKLLRPVFG